jgi:hypothetical protein
VHYGQECIVFHYNNVLKYPENWTCHTKKNNTLSRISSFPLEYTALVDKTIHSGYSDTYQNHSGDYIAEPDPDALMGVRVARAIEAI